MNIEQFEIFRTITQAKSFTKAAKILNFTQPAISSQIKSLEQNFNVSLFERGNTGVRLTEAGKIFYDYGEKILAIYAEMEAEIAKISGQSKEFINVGASYTAGNYFLPSSIITFKELNPNVHIRLDIGHSQDIIDQVRDKIIDIGVVEGNLANEPEFQKFKIESNDLVIIVPPRGKWLTKNKISLESLLEEPFIAREEESAIRHFVNSYLKTLGLSFNDFNIVTEITNWEAIKEAVIRNKGVSLVPYPVVKRELSEGRLLTIQVDDLQLSWDMEVVVRSNENFTGLKKEFLDFITNPDTLWSAEKEYITNQKMRFI
ncbi:MAG: LysR family transcriptional regulator [Syntrophomonadaceae bacterium]|nr:LysR family transcriptional regulator [Syntrophomonadaceae bacterium]